MKVVFRKSFARDLKKVKDEHVLYRVLQAIDQAEAALARIIHSVQESHGFRRVQKQGAFSPFDVSQLLVIGSGRFDANGE